MDGIPPIGPIPPMDHNPKRRRPTTPEKKGEPKTPEKPEDEGLTEEQKRTRDAAKKVVNPDDYVGHNVDTHG